MYVTISQDTAQPLFEVAPTDFRKPLKSLKKGKYLYFEGDDVTHLFLIESGVVRLTRVLEDGRRQVIAFGYPGDIIGFPAGDTHHTDCDALSEAKLCVIPRKALSNSHHDPELHRVLIDAALAEISAMQDHFMMLGRKSAAEKVASFLKVLLERIGDADRVPPIIELPMSRADIADFLGLTTETVCRCLTALRKLEIIRLDGVSKVEVLDPPALAERADGKFN